MVWFKVDDGMHAHPKTLAAGNSAIGLWTVCGSWSSDQLTEGFVPAAMALRYGTRAECRALVAAGLWTEVEGGYQFHDFDEYNPSADAVQADRAAAAERQRRAREKAKSQRESRRDGGVTHGVSNGVSNGEVRAQSRSPRPDPTRPTIQTPTESAAPTITQRSKRITDAYAEQVPLSNWPAVNGVVLKALKSERYADDEIGSALLRLAIDGRAVTVDVLRTELEGFGQRASPNRTTERLNQGLAVVRKLEAQARGELA